MIGGHLRRDPPLLDRPGGRYLYIWSQLTPFYEWGPNGQRQQIPPPAREYKLCVIDTQTLEGEVLPVAVRGWVSDGIFFATVGM